MLPCKEKNMYLRIGERNIVFHCPLLQWLAGYLKIISWITLLFFTGLRSPFFNHNFLCVLCVVQSHFSHVQLFVTPSPAVTLWTVAQQAPLSMGFSRWEYWSGLPCPPGDLPNPGIEPMFLTSPALAGGFFTTTTTWEARTTSMPLKLELESSHCVSNSSLSHVDQISLASAFLSSSKWQQAFVVAVV